jgi:sugar phosphate permease
MFVAQAISVGATGYAYSLFLEPIGAEFGIAPARLGLGQSGLLFAMMLAGPLLGIALDRRSIRALVIGGALIFAAGFALMAAAASIAALAGIYWVLISVGSLLAGPVSANKLVANWFVRMRGRALGVSSVGTSAGGALLPPLSAWAIEAFGWRGALLLLAGPTAACIVPAAAWAIANRPEDRGQTPDGDAGVPLAPDPVEPRGIAVSALVRDGNYWGIALAFGLAWAVIASLLSFFGVYAKEDLRIEASAAGWVLSLLSISAVVGKLAFGAAAERIDARWFVCLGIALQLGFIAILRMQPGYALLLGSSIGFGLSLGGLLPMHGALVAGYYGRSSFASVMGAMGPIMTPLMFGATALASWLPGVTGGYERLFEIFLAAQVLALLALGLLRPVRSA